MDYIANALLRILIIAPGFLIGIMVHEVAHGYAALKFGDPTAKLEGRLSFNPARHLDLYGSVILPLLLILLGSRVIFGMAKPVPINPYRFKNYRVGLRVVSLAGVIANLLTAIVVGNSIGILANFLYVNFPNLTTSIFQQVVVNTVTLNIFLAIFNLIPIPPLDGSKVLASFLSWQAMNRYLAIERYGFIIIFAFLFLFSSFFWGIVSPVVEIFYKVSFIWQLFI